MTPVQRIAPAMAATHTAVLLPGAYMAPADFVAAGFADALAARGLAWELLMPAYTVPDIVEGRALAHLQALLHGLPQPPLLLGISLGGLLALTAVARGAAAAQLVLLAPYPGPRPVSDPILAAPSLAEAAIAEPAADDVDRQAWRWWQAQAAQQPGLWLGTGRADRFAASHRRMAEALPARAFCETEGGHDWPTWAALWAHYLDAHHAA